MHEHVAQEDEQERAPASPPARGQVQQPAAMALQLQRTVGNRATAQMVQRWNPITGLIPEAALGLGFKLAWRKFVAMNRDSASYLSIPPNWRQLAIDYAHEAPGDDGKFLEIGIKRLPSCWTDGWIIGQVDSATHAITLDTDVFFNPAAAGEPHVDTYVHELVHVAQYAIEGVEGFLGDYGVDMLEGWISGGFDADAAYHSVRFESHAAAVDERFKAWREKREAEEKAKPKPDTPRDPLDEARDTLKAPSPISEVGGFPLTGSVGAKGDNRPEDVQRVAGRLHGLGFLARITTDIDEITDAIYDYQSRVLGWPRPDGRVDVGNKTHRALKAGRKTVSMAL